MRPLSHTHSVARRIEIRLRQAAAASNIGESYAFIVMRLQFAFMLWRRFGALQSIDIKCDRAPSLPRTIRSRNHGLPCVWSGSGISKQAIAEAMARG